MPSHPNQNPSNILSKVVPLSKRTRYLKALLYGLPGVGKTTLAASGPDCLVIDIERGTKSLLLEERFEAVQICEPDSFQDVDDLFWAIRNKHLTPKSLSLDSISEFQRVHLDEILEAAHKKDPSKVDQYLAQQQHYRLSTEMMRRHVLAFRELPLHFIVTAHAIEDKDELGKIAIRPAVTPKLSGTLIGMMDLIGYLEVDEKGERRLTCRPTRRIQAKNRIGLPTEIKNPTWADITEPLKNSQEPELEWSIK